MIYIKIDFLLSIFIPFTKIASKLTLQVAKEDEQNENSIENQAPHLTPNTNFSLNTSLEYDCYISCHV